MSGLVLGKRLAILGLEVERYDILCFLNLPLDDKLPPTSPSTVLVQLFPPSETDPGQVPIRGRPRIIQLALEHVGTDDGGDSTKEVLADDGVLGGLNAKRSVLAAETLDSREKGSKIVNVGGIRINSTSQSFSLIATLEGNRESSSAAALWRA